MSSLKTVLMPLVLILILAVCVDIFFRAFPPSSLSDQYVVLSGNGEIHVLERKGLAWGKNPKFSLALIKNCQGVVGKSDGENILVTSKCSFLPDVSFETDLGEIARDSRVRTKEVF